MTALPTTPQTVAMFIAAEVYTGRANATLEHQLVAIRVVYLRAGEEILALAEKIASYTIDKIMAMDDEELGLKVMSGEIDRPGSPSLSNDITPPVQGPDTSKTLTDADKHPVRRYSCSLITIITKLSTIFMDNPVDKCEKPLTAHAFLR